MSDPDVPNVNTAVSLETPAAAMSPVALRGVIHIQSKWRGDRVRDELVWSDNSGEDVHEIPRGNTQESIKASSELDSCTAGIALKDDSLVTPTKQAPDSNNNTTAATAAAAEARRVALEEAATHATELRAQLAKAEEARLAAVRETGACAYMYYLIVLHDEPSN